jgi:hypothetical protein
MFWGFSGTLPNLDLILRNAAGIVVAASRSPIDNVEYIWAPSLPAGAYTLAVEGPPGVRYGIAWRGAAVSPAPEPPPVVAPPVVITPPAPVVTPPSITTNPSPLAALAGTPATFTVASAGSPPLAYAWARGGSALPGATSATLTIAAISPADAGSYTVTVSNSAGSVTSAPAILAVLVYRTVTLTASGGATYRWIRNGQTIPGATGTALTDTFDTAQRTPDYSVEIRLTP